MEKCNCCGKEFIAEGCGTGYGTNREGKKICYQCCGDIDRAELLDAKPGQRFCHYLTGNAKDGQYVSNWPNTFKVRVIPRRSRHNFGIWRYDFWFSVGHAKFHGYQIGENTQIAHIRCIKAF